MNEYESLLNVTNEESPNITNTEIKSEVEQTPPEQVTPPPEQVIQSPEQVIQPPEQVIQPPEQVIQPPEQVTHPPTPVVQQTSYDDGNKDESEKIKGVSKRFKVGSAEDRGRRISMEDQTVIYGSLEGNELEDYFAVFDGHGGIAASKFCASSLHNEITSVLRQKASDDLTDMKTLMKEAFVRCNESLKELNTCSETGTTAVVAYSRGNRLWIANVGDSRAVLSKNGSAVRITTDHKPSLQSEKNRILEQKGFVFFGRVNGVLAVSRALGDFNFNPHVTCEPDVFGPFDVDDKENQFLILACDGLWDVIDDDKAVQIIRDSKSPEEGARVLVSAAINGRSMDNVSVVVVFFPHYVPQ